MIMCIKSVFLNNCLPSKKCRVLAREQPGLVVTAILDDGVEDLEHVPPIRGWNGEKKVIVPHGLAQAAQIRLPNVEMFYVLEKRLDFAHVFTEREIGEYSDKLDRWAALRTGWQRNG